MTFSENVGLIYFVIPFIFVIKNKIRFLFQILIGSRDYKIILEDGTKLKFSSLQFDVVLALLGILTFSNSYLINKKKELNISFGKRSNFTIPLENLSFEDCNLILTLFGGLRHGADFVTSDEDFRFPRDKTFKISDVNGKKIIETYNGVKFYMDSIHPGNTIVQTFLRKIHRITLKDDWTNKVVVDVGAECGDTALYYAKLGANVYAVEPIEAHYNAMLRNLSLNPELAKRITAIQAGIGRDGVLEFYQSIRAEIAEMASYVYNVHGKDFRICKVKGYSFDSFLKEFNIKHIDLFKIDCKGCEFNLTESVLENVDAIKISNTYDPSPQRKQEDLINLLERAGFRCVVYRSNPNRDRHSTKLGGQILGIKIKNTQTNFYQNNTR